MWNMSRIGEIHGTANGCASCGHQFAALAQFDAHQDIDYDRDPVLICHWPTDLGLVQDDRGVWQTPEGLVRREANRVRGLEWVASRYGAGAQSAADPDLVLR